MKLTTDFVESQKEAIDNATLRACQELGLDEDTFPVRQRVSDIMMDKLKGRTVPIIKRNSSLGSHKFYNDNLFEGMYPKKLVTDRQKFEFLKKKINDGYISATIFLDLVSVLNIPEKEVRKVDVGLNFY